MPGRGAGPGEHQIPRTSSRRRARRGSRLFAAVNRCVSAPGRRGASSRRFDAAPEGRRVGEHLVFAPREARQELSREAGGAARLLAGGCPAAGRGHGRVSAWGRGVTAGSGRRESPAAAAGWLLQSAAAGPEMCYLRARRYRTSVCLAGRATTAARG